MRVVEFVHRLVMTIGKDCRFGIMGVVVRARFRMFFWLDHVCKVFRDDVEFLLQGTCATLTMLTTAGI